MLSFTVVCGYVYVNVVLYGGMRVCVCACGRASSSGVWEIAVDQSRYAAECAILGLMWLGHKEIGSGAQHLLAYLKEQT